MILGVLILFYSIYTFLTATDGLMMGKGLLRVALTLLGLVALRFNEEIVLTMAVLLYVVVTLALFAFTRHEVQLKND